jgi:hypothetical protein
MSVLAGFTSQQNLLKHAVGTQLRRTIFGGISIPLPSFRGHRLESSNVSDKKAWDRDTEGNPQGGMRRFPKLVSLWLAVIQWMMMSRNMGLR